MKRAVIILVMTLMAYPPALAQKTGLTAGIMSSTISADFDELRRLGGITDIPVIKSMTTFYVGGYMDLNLSARLTFTPELRYAQKGSVADQELFEVRDVRHSLLLPATFRYRIHDRISLNGGLEYVYLLSNVLRGDIRANTTSQAKRHDLSALIGISARVSHRLSLDLRYNLGVLDLTEGFFLPQSNGSVQFVDLSSYSRALQLGIRIELFSLDGLSQRRQQRNQTR